MWSELTGKRVFRILYAALFLRLFCCYVKHVEKKKVIMTQIFGNNDTYGLVDSMTMEEFDERLNALNTEWEIGGAEMVEFKEYFRKYKEDELKYHVMKVAVKAAEITGTTYGYYSLLLILILRSTTKVLQLVGGIFQNEIF